VKLFLIFTSTPFDYLLISRVTNHTYNPRFFTYLLYRKISCPMLPWQFCNFTSEIINCCWNVVLNLRSNLLPMISNMTFKYFQMPFHESLLPTSKRKQNKTKKQLQVLHSRDFTWLRSWLRTTNLYNKKYLVSRNLTQLKRDGKSFIFAICCKRHA